jgi:hypothetical protein
MHRSPFPSLDLDSLTDLQPLEYRSATRDTTTTPLEWCGCPVRSHRGRSIGREQLRQVPIFARVPGAKTLGHGDVAIGLVEKTSNARVGQRGMQYAAEKGQYRT